MMDELFGDAEPMIPGQDVDNFEAPDLSPEEIADHIARSTATALESTGLIEIKELTSAVGQVHFLGRVKDNRKKDWARLVKKMLVVMQKDCDGFIGTQNIIKLQKGAVEDSTNPDDYDHKFGHIISFGSRNLKGAAERICQVVVDDNPSPRAEVTSAPMLGSGAPSSGGRSTGRKGAHLTAGARK